MTNADYLYYLFLEYNKKINVIKNLDIISVEVTGIDSGGHTQYIDFNEDVEILMKNLLKEERYK